MRTKRLRIFAGPNGSGKSTIYNNLITTGDLNFGIFVNADDIEKTMKLAGRLNFSNYGIALNIDDFCQSYCDSKFYKLGNGDKIISILSNCYDELIIADKNLVNSYFTAFIADYIRVIMLDFVDVFTVETVMSHPSKLEYIKLAKSKGYRVYLYFVSTCDATINISRVAYRVGTGGHDVPSNKIISRYTKSLENLYDAMRLSDRAYVFDNSDSEKPIWYVEYTDGEVTINEDSIPKWIDDYLICKLR